VVSNLAGRMDVCLLWLLCVVRKRYLRRADNSSRRILHECGLSKGDLFIMKFDIGSFFKNLSRKRIKGTLYEDHSTFLIPRSVLLRMRNVAGKSCREYKNTHFVSSNFL